MSQRTLSHKFSIIKCEYSLVIYFIFNLQESQYFKDMFNPISNGWPLISEMVAEVVIVIRMIIMMV